MFDFFGGTRAARSLFTAFVSSKAKMAYTIWREALKLGPSRSRAISSTPKGALTPSQAKKARLATPAGLAVKAMSDHELYREAASATSTMQWRARPPSSATVGARTAPRWGLPRRRSSHSPLHGWSHPHCHAWSSFIRLCAFTFPPPLSFASVRLRASRFQRLCPFSHYYASSYGPLAVPQSHPHCHAWSRPLPSLFASVRLRASRCRG